MRPTDDTLIAELKSRLANPAVTDSELATYLAMSKRDVSTSLYSDGDYTSQVLDTACYLLSLDNKFPELQSISQNGVTTSFAANDPERWRRRISERRQAFLIEAGA